MKQQSSGVGRWILSQFWVFDVEDAHQTSKGDCYVGQSSKKGKGSVGDQKLGAINVSAVKKRREKEKERKGKGKEEKNFFMEKV